LRKTLIVPQILGVEDRPTIYLIAGCNGAGKTTFAMEFLPKEVKCLRFLNADEIARGLSPLDPAAAALKAGRLLIEQFRECVEKRETFSVESTLSGRTYVGMLKEAVAVGYEIELHYLLLANAAQAIRRVRSRVRNGGHDVPAKDVRRRFVRGRKNLIDDYLPLAARWTVWDSRVLPPKRLASSPQHDIDSVIEILRK
jgi:predicted ABC-type ATPase